MDNQPTISFWRIIKFGLLAGLVFGGGYWYAALSIVEKSDTQLPKKQTRIEDAEKKFAEYQKVKDRIKLTYFKELTSKPRQESIGQAPETPAETVQPVRAPKLEDSQSSDRLANALEKVLGNETPQTVSAAASTKLPEVTGSPYALQVASFPDRKIAEEFANRLSLKGYDAKLVQAEVAERGTVFRIRIHGFETRDEAEKMRRKLALTEKLDSITVAQ